MTADPTYRERRRARVERLRGWAGKREEKSAAAFEAVEDLTEQIPLGQPILVGHHSESHARRDQDRIHAGMRAGIDHAAKAESMRERANRIESAAQQAIYSDDPDALERLAAKIADLEAERARIKAFNAAVRKAGAVTSDALALLDARQRDDLVSLARHAPWQMGTCGQFPAYATSNLSSSISRERKRLAELSTTVAECNDDRY